MKSRELVQRRLRKSPFEVCRAASESVIVLLYTAQPLVDQSLRSDAIRTCEIRQSRVCSGKQLDKSNTRRNGVTQTPMDQGE